MNEGNVFGLRKKFRLNLLLKCLVNATPRHFRFDSAMQRDESDSLNLLLIHQCFFLSLSEPPVVLAEARVVPEAPEDLLDLESLVQGERGGTTRGNQRRLRSVHVAIVDKPGSGPTQAPETSQKNAVPTSQLVWVHSGKGLR
jgi:hypothetical protein